MQQSKERRNRLRRRAEIPVNLRLADGQVLATGTVKNLSLGGAFIQMHDPLPVNMDIEVEFLLPDKPNVIRCPATVVWTSDEHGEKTRPEITGIGVQLRQLGSTELTYLTGLLQEHASALE